MKKAFILSVFVLLFAGQVFAAGSSMSVSSDLVINGPDGARSQRVITIAFVADDTDGSIPSLTFTAASGAWTDGTLTGTLKTPIEGWFLYQVEIDCNHAGTEPTEDSELYIYKNSFDLLRGGGVNQVDNSAERIVHFSDGTSSILAPVTGDIVVTATQQAAATNDATGTFKIVLVP